MTDHRFIAYVTLSDTDMRRVNASTIVARVKQRFGGKISMEIAPRGGDGGILLDIDGTLITALLIDKPLPPDAYARALDIDRVWPEARATLAANRAISRSAFEVPPMPCNCPAYPRTEQRASAPQHLRLRGATRRHGACSSEGGERWCFVGVFRWAMLPENSTLEAHTVIGRCFIASVMLAHRFASRKLGTWVAA